VRQVISELTIARNVPARMRDGVVLRANVYRPTVGGPWPVLLTRTPYGKDLPGAAAWLDPVRAAAAGFMVIVQDVRGRFASSGEWEPFTHESSDGYDTVQWAAGLDGSNGRVGMFGLSYWGSTQWLAAIAQPPALCAIAPGMTWSDPDDGLLRRGGAVQLASGVVWGLEQGLDCVRRSADSPDQVRRRLRGLVTARDSVAHRELWQLPASVSSLLNAHGVPGLGEGAAAAARCRVSGRHDRVHVPVFGIGGWHDAFLQGVLDNHSAMVALGRDTRIVIGPWSHSNWTDVVGGLSFGVDARMDGGPTGGPGDLGAMQLDWFRHHLTPARTREQTWPPARVFVMGIDRWREEATWPPPGAVRWRWYLQSGGTLSPTSSAAGEPVGTFVYDPSDPVPSTPAGTSLSSPDPSGPVEQTAIEARPDVLVFTSAQLPEDLEVAGRVRVGLHARSSAPSTDWVARLCDVRPDGSSYRICDGILRVSDAHRPQLREIDLWSTHNVFRRGHRVRLQITSSSFPRWDRNLNTGDQSVAAHRPAHQRLLSGSWLELPAR